MLTRQLEAPFPQGKGASLIFKNTRFFPGKLCYQQVRQVVIMILII